jgi:hypothetical protein
LKPDQFKAKNIIVQDSIQRTTKGISGEHLTGQMKDGASVVLWLQIP